jgi:drug/metabolite transporter (DMT)-like permease
MRSAASMHGNPTVKLHTMSKVDVAKEKIAYMRLWMGLALALIASLIGWGVANFTSATIYQVVSAVLSVFILVNGSYFLHRRITKRIEELEPM